MLITPNSAPSQKLIIPPAEIPAALEDETVRPTAFTLLYSCIDPGQILLQNPAREPDPDIFLPPQGGIDPGETPETATHREVKEELGIDLVDEPVVIGAVHNRTAKPRNGCSTKLLIASLAPINPYDIPNLDPMEVTSASWFSVADALQQTDNNERLKGAAPNTLPKAELTRFMINMHVDTNLNGRL